MTFSDIFKKSFLEGYAGAEITTGTILIALIFSALIGLYIFFCYRILTRRTFYSKNFNISLVAMAIITCAVILTIQSSVVVSLGMVGALSIVRFRTAIKDPMDLVFLFWSISVGIICGAGFSQIAVILSLIVTVLLFLLDRLPVARAPMILVVNGTMDGSIVKEITSIARKYSTGFTIKTQRITEGRLDLVAELRVKDGNALVQDLSAIRNIDSVSLLSHDGEVTF